MDERVSRDPGAYLLFVDLVRDLLELPGASVPVPGFGSSDCRACPAHLVALPAGFDPGL